MDCYQIGNTMFTVNNGRSAYLVHHQAELSWQQVPLRLGATQPVHTTSPKFNSAIIVLTLLSTHFFKQCPCSVSSFVMTKHHKRSILIMIR